MKSITKIKSFLVLILCLFGMSCLTACGPETVPVGNVGIKVYKYGAAKGIDHDVLGLGWYWIGINEELYLFPVTAQHYVFTESKNEGKESDESITFQTADGMSIGADVGISYSIDPSKVTVLFQKYRMDLKDITTTWIRLAIRNELNKQGAKDSLDNILGGGKELLFKRAQDSVQAQFDSVGIKDFRMYIVGKFRLPSNLENSINLKVEATQNMIRAKADADRKVIEATSEAKANELKRSALTPDLVELEWIKKWDGHLPQYNAGQLPMMTVPAPHK
jgi:regulator of protease activity HflC (stomatin/prohibitin superfamily)